jgi:hypothetical protein
VGLYVTKKVAATYFTSFCFNAIDTASVRLVTPSLERILETLNLANELFVNTLPFYSISLSVCTVFLVNFSYSCDFDATKNINHKTAPNTHKFIPIIANIFCPDFDPIMPMVNPITITINHTINPEFSSALILSEFVMKRKITPIMPSITEMHPKAPGLLLTK